MAISNYIAGKLIGLATIGDSPDAAFYDPKLHLAYSSNGEGTLTVVDADKTGYPAVQTIATARGARTMAYDVSTGKVFLSAAKDGPAPAPTVSNPHPRPAIIPGSFEILVVSH
jgi:hypothetical protein